MDTINIDLPLSWSSLSQSQLYYAFVALAGAGADNNGWINAATRCVQRWGGFRIICPYGRNYLVSIRRKNRRRKSAARTGKSGGSKSGGSKSKPHDYIMDSDEFTFAILQLRWLSEIPDAPVRLDTIDGAVAMPDDPTEVMTFAQWLACENFWQGYQATRDNSMLREMAAILYSKDNITLTPAHTLSIFYWWAAIKEMLSARFPNFLKPAPAASQDTPDLRAITDSQIRALTKGDISKESQILSMTASRALTELDAQAREFDELNKKYPQK